jgi:hypothetical protein
VETSEPGRGGAGTGLRGGGLVPAARGAGERGGGEHGGRGWRFDGSGVDCGPVSGGGGAGGGGGGGSEAAHGGKLLRVLAWSSGSGLARVERASRELALREFDDFARTAVGPWRSGRRCWVRCWRTTGCSMLTEGEELVFEGVVRWMKGGEGEEIPGSGLLGKTRFPLMEEGYLAGLLREGCGELAGLEELVGEKVGLKRVGRGELGRQRLRHLDHLTPPVWIGRRGGGEERRQI